MLKTSVIKLSLTWSKNYEIKLRYEKKHLSKGLPEDTMKKLSQYPSEEEI